MPWPRPSLQRISSKSETGSSSHANVDIIVVKGLSVEPSTKLRTKALEELLPKVATDARVLCCLEGPSTSALFSGTTADVVDWAYHFLMSLMDLRQTESENQRPIVFVGYSFGGLLVKQLLLLAHSLEQFNPIVQTTTGVVFLGTPHHGTEKGSYGKVLSVLASSSGVSALEMERLQDGLEINCDDLQQLTSEFVSTFQGPVLSFYSTRTSSVVSEEDCTLLGMCNEEHIPLDTDHEGLFRLVGRKSPILERIQRGIAMLRHQGLYYTALPHQEKNTALPAYCPVCRSLPLHDHGLDVTTSARYNTSLDAQVQKVMRHWAHRCALANFVSKNMSIWSGGEPHPARELEQTLAWEYICSPPWDESPRLSLGIDHDHSLTEKFQNIMVHSDPLSSESIAQVKYWIDRCRRNHPECGLEWTPLPTRVLDVSDLGSIKLVRPLGLEDKYVAFSHCWGSEKPFLATRQNMKFLKAGFRIRQIPESFRDAILVTRQLGIRYLWIDSLCIVQGDVTDWEIEVGRMADIYLNAHVTISAARSSGDNQSFLVPRSGEYMPLTITAEHEQLTAAYIYKKRQWQDHEQQPLDSRAWALQEQYISRRNVRYCDKEMTWRCRMAFWTESQPPNETLRYWEKPWTALVEAFSRRDLTYETDRLSAISGIASTVASINGEDYCAGLWLKNMPDELLFTREAAVASKEYVAPTWSWAATGSPITFIPPRVNGYSRLSQVKVSSHDLKTPPSNRFGQLKRRGSMKIKAPFVSLYRQDEIPGRAVSPFRLTGRVRGKDWSRIVVDCKFDSRDEPNEEIFGLLLGYSDPSQMSPSISPPPRAHAMRQATSSQPDPTDQTHRDCLYGLLLKECEDDSAQRRPFAAKLFGRSKGYERCGYFEIQRLSHVQRSEIVEGHLTESVTLF